MERIFSRTPTVSFFYCRALTTELYVIVEECAFGPNGVTQVEFYSKAWDGREFCVAEESLNKVFRFMHAIRICELLFCSEYYYGWFLRGKAKILATRRSADRLFSSSSPTEVNPCPLTNQISSGIGLYKGRFRIKVANKVQYLSQHASNDFGMGCWASVREYCPFGCYLS